MRNDARLGIALMVAAMVVFASQDGLSRYLAERYNVLMVVMIRYWFFALFVIAIARRRAGSIRAAAATRQPWLQAFRGVLLAAEICVSVVAYVAIGLIETHAIFAAYPLIIASLAGPVLGERMGWRRWLAVAAGFVGILIILQPGAAVFSPSAALALLAAFMFAVYGLATRYAARKDSAATSFFWTGTTGAVAITAVGVWVWEPLLREDWAMMGLLCVMGALGHYLLIKVYEVAEASTVQPFAYLHLVFAAVIGVSVFGEALEWNIVVGAVIVVGAGLFTLWRESLSR